MTCQIQIFREAVCRYYQGATSAKEDNAKLREQIYTASEKEAAEAAAKQKKQ